MPRYTEDQQNEDIYPRGRKTATTSKKKVSTKKKKKKKIWKIILLIIFILLIVFGGIFAYRFHKNGGGVSGFLATVVGHDENTKKSLTEIQFLLIGESGNMTDSLIACSYNPNTQQASMLSIPRDTFVGKSLSKTSSSDKINSLYNRYKDPQKLIDAINDLTGLNLEYYILVDTKALTELVDAIGGVEFNVPIDMNYDDTSKENYIRIHLQKGLQKITGEQAEGLLRFRHNNDGSSYPFEYGDQDFGRMRTQREFITATLKQTLKPGNIFKLGQILDIANENVKTNIPLSLAKDYLPYAVEFNTENLHSNMLPGESTNKYNGIWIYLQDEAKSQILVNNLFFGGDYDPENVESDSEVTTVQVLNGSNDAKNLYTVVNKLKENGFQVIKVGNTSSTKKTSIVNRTKQSEEVTDKLKTILGIGTVTTGKNNVKTDITVTIGKDYK